MPFLEVEGEAEAVLDDVGAGLLEGLRQAAQFVGQGARCGGIVGLRASICIGAGLQNWIAASGESSPSGNASTLPLQFLSRLVSST